uniref:LITAF domain-containing protein n=1 Tax=Plectus sambesii TaxID=2011161 RepID=A0A914UMQ2_9BILA
MDPSSIPPKSYQNDQPNAPQTIVTFYNLPDHPTFMNCPWCNTNVTTQAHLKNGLLVWVIVIVLLIVCFPLAFIPCCLQSCKDVEHYCPKCSHFIGVKKRIE